MRLPWLSRITARYASILAAVTLIPLLLVVAAYDRYASDLLGILTGTRLEQRMAMMHGRLASFVEARFAQLDTLANYPDLALAVTTEANPVRAGAVRAVLEYEADNPDLYGILIFGASGTMLDAIPSQAASGAPYWGGRWEPLREGHPQIETARGRVIGPFLPSEGRPGSVLLLRRLQSTPDQQEVVIALHIRLSSLTELLGEKTTGDLAHPILMTSGGTALSVIGRPVAIHGEVVAGPEVMPGWKVGLLLETGSVARPLATVREGLLAAAVAVVTGVVALVFLLGARLNRRIGRLVDGSTALAQGRLDTRIVDDGRDELAILAGAFNRMSARMRDTINATGPIRHELRTRGSQSARGREDLGAGAARNRQRPAASAPARRC